MPDGLAGEALAEIDFLIVEAHGCSVELPFGLLKALQLQREPVDARAQKGSYGVGPRDYRK